MVTMQTGGTHASCCVIWEAEALFSRRCRMTWNQWYAVRSYIRSSLWLVPFVALLLEQLALRTAVALRCSFRLDTFLALE